MPFGKDPSLLVKAGLFLDIPDLALPLFDPLNPGEQDSQRRLIAKKISRLQNLNSENQSILENLVVMRDWLQGRPLDYREWVLPCLDYLFSTIVAHHGQEVPELLVKAGFFDFASFQQNFLPTERMSKPEDDPEIQKILELLRSSNPQEIRIEKELDLATLLSDAGEPDYDYLYLDGCGFCETEPKKMARERALRLIDYSPDTEEFHRRLGFLLLTLGEFANAIVCFQRQLTHNQEDGVVYDNLAWCQMKLGRLDAALSNASKARNLAPQKIDIHHDYAGILMLLGRLDEALVVTSQALKDFPDGAPQLQYLHALLLDRSGLKNQAVPAWRYYLRRYQRLPGHQRAVLRAIAFLRECGHPHTLTEFPIRKIADDMRIELENRIDRILNCLKEYGISINRLQEFAKKNQTESSREDIENRCNKMLDETETILLSCSLVLDTAKIREMFAELRNERENKEITFQIALSGFAKPLLNNIIGHLKPISGGHGYHFIFDKLLTQSKMIDDVLELAGWYSFHELIKRSDGGTPTLDIMENLLVAWQNKTQKPPKVIQLSDLLDDLRKIQPEILKMIESGEDAFCQKNIQSLRSNYELKLKKAQEAIQEVQTRLADEEKAFREDEKWLNGARHQANRDISKWGTVRQESENLILKVEQITKEVASCLRIKKARGLWAALKKHGRIVSEVGHHVSQLAKQLIQFTPDGPNLSPLPATPDGILTKLKNEVPTWLFGTKEHLCRQAQRGNDRILISKTTIKEVDRLLKERQTTFQETRQQAKTEEKNQIMVRDQAQKVANALEKIEKEAPFREFIPGRDIIAISVVDIAQNPSSSTSPSYFFYGGITDGMAVFRGIGASWQKDLFQHQGGVTGLVLHPSGRFLASAGMDGTITIWTVNLPKEVRRIQIISIGTPIYSLTFGEKYLFAGTDNQIAIYALPDFARVATIDTIDGKIFALACNNEQERLYALGSSFEIPSFNKLSVLDMTGDYNFRVCKCMHEFGNIALSMNIDPTGKWIAAGEGLGSINEPESSRVFIWDAITLRLKTVFTSHEGWVDSLAFSPNGRWLFSGDGAGPINNPKPSKFYLHDLESNSTLLAVEAHKGWVRSFAFAGGCRFLLSGGSDGIWCWDIAKLTAGL